MPNLKPQLPGKPGNIHMKCMIWENQPMCTRADQNETFPLSAETIKTLPDYVKNSVSFAQGLQGVWLKEKIVYHNNFITSKGQLFESQRTDMQAYFDCNKLPALSPLDAETPHFMWTLSGSLFYPDSISPADIINNTPASLDPKFSKWTHEIITIPRENSSTSTSTSAATPPVIPNCAPAPANGAAATPAPQKLPDTLRFFPSQGAVSQATRWVQAQPAAGAAAGGAGGGNAAPATQTAFGVHWKASKNTKLFQGEDFFIEFRKRAYTPNTINSTIALDPKYEFLDTGSNAEYSGGFIVNAGVVDVDENNAVIDQSRANFDFNSQPYYIIELGVGDPNHNYFIILAENAKPRMVHVSSTVPVPVIDPQAGLIIAAPPQPVSRVLSIYNATSSKELLSKDVLRIQVRQHLGFIVVTFVGYENDPWVIFRKDPVLVNKQQPSSDPQDFTTTKVPMIIANQPIAIYGGNVKVAWTFGPLIYDQKASVALPQAIVVKGPVALSDLNLRLCEQSTQPGVTDVSLKYTYNQDAEQYKELINGVDKSILQYVADPKKVTAQGKAPDKGKNGAKGAGLSFISISAQSSLSPSGGSGGSNNGSSGAINTSTTTGGAAGTNASSISSQQQMAASFYGVYSLGSGDYIFPVDAANGATKTWRVNNCITPIATGYRMYVPAAGCSSMPPPVDVAQHVLSFSDNWSSQDLFKVDHSGSITFLITPEQTGVSRQNDYSAYLAALHDKTFYIRIYAWWTDGFMACLPGCTSQSNQISGPVTNCDGCASCMAANCIFTGLCHGGSISDENGRKIMECQILDYWKILQDLAFINAPIFDGVRDFNAMFTIIKMAGFRDGTEGPSSIGGKANDTWPPAALLKIFSDSSNADMYVPWPTRSCIQSQTIYSQEYALPSSYDVLQSPSKKPSDGSSFEAFITQIAQLAGNVTYFDRWGVFHYEDRLESQSQFLGISPLRLYTMNFYASPADFPDQICENPYQQVIGSYTYKANVADVFNIIHIFGSTPDGGPVFADNVNWPSIYDPTKAGYIGYRKLKYQQDGIFGSQEAVANATQYYSGIFKPPISVSWGALGNGRVIPSNLVSFSGLQIDNTALNMQPLRVTSVSNTIEPQSNMWTAKYEAEFVFLGTNQ